MAADGGAERRQEMLMLVIANARVFGGGFRIAPQADLADGQLDVVAFANMPLRRRFPLMVKLLRGTHAAQPEVAAGRGRSFRLRFDAPPAYETDGEWNRARSSELHVECVPGALRVLVPASAA
jgi:diacylglycerol kinase family enzyme